MKTVPEIDVEKIGQLYYLWIHGEISGVYKDLNEISKILEEEELENERRVSQ